MKDYRGFSIELAKEAGRIIKANFVLGMKKEWKTDNTPLTETDTQVNQLVIDAVKKEFPEHSVLAEEGNNFSEKSEYVWVCDPVDGTIPFSHGIPACVFSLALVQNGESILGVLYDPFLDRMLVAEKGKGALLNSIPTRVSQRGELRGTLIGISWWKNELANFFPLAETLDDKGVLITDISSIGYMEMLVAMGEFGGTIFSGVKPHDTAAGKIIIEEAGGKVTNLFGEEQRYDRDIKGHIASNGILHQELVDLFKSNR
jgi:myo-inositol-1(or 4)-monophosphatase